MLQVVEHGSQRRPLNVPPARVYVLCKTMRTTYVSQKRYEREIGAETLKDLALRVVHKARAENFAMVDGIDKNLVPMKTAATAIKRQLRTVDVSLKEKSLFAYRVYHRRFFNDSLSLCPSKSFVISHAIRIHTDENNGPADCPRPALPLVKGEVAAVDEAEGTKDCIWERGRRWKECRGRWTMSNLPAKKRRSEGFRVGK